MGLLITLGKKKKKPWPPLITIEPIKNKIQPLQKFCPLNVEKKISKNAMFTTFSQYFCNKFLITGCYWLIENNFSGKFKLE